MSPITPAQRHATVVVSEGAVYTDRGLATASWYDTYELVPGEYPVEFVTCSGHEVKGNWDNHSDGSPYRMSVRIPAKLVESFRVNRLFNASSAHTETPNIDMAVYLSCYAYSVEEGHALAYMNAPTEADKWARKAIATIHLAAGGAAPSEPTIATTAPAYMEEAGQLF